MKRSRILYSVIIILSICCGLASRKFSFYLPQFIAEYAGDTLWALTVYFLISAVFNRVKITHAAVLALSFSYLIELSQLYQAGWVNSIRSTVLGGLILGFGFLWSDIACYTAGVIIAVFIDISLQRIEGSEAA